MQTGRSAREIYGTRCLRAVVFHISRSSIALSTARRWDWLPPHPGGEAVRGEAVRVVIHRLPRPPFKGRYALRP